MTEKSDAEKCKTNAQKAIKKSVANPSNGVPFFYSGNSVPSWAKGKSPCVVIEGHKFFKNIALY